MAFSSASLLATFSAIRSSIRLSSFSYLSASFLRSFSMTALSASSFLRAALSPLSRATSASSKRASLARAVWSTAASSRGNGSGASASSLYTFRKAFSADLDRRVRLSISV